MFSPKTKESMDNLEENLNDKAFRRNVVGFLPFLVCFCAFYFGGLYVFKIENKVSTHTYPMLAPAEPMTPFNT